MNATKILVALASLSGIQAQLNAQPASLANPVVTVENFVRAESDTYFRNFLAESGGLGQLSHRREPASIDNQTVIRLNRDTLYSSGVFDLDAGPVTITLPDAGERFRSLMVINQDHYVPFVVYDVGPHSFSRDAVGTRYMALAIRTFVDPADAADLAAAHALQDAIRVEQAAAGTLELPEWDPVSQKRIRDALLVLAASRSDFGGAFGAKGEVDPISHLIGTAAGWGGNPDRDASYISVAPELNDGQTIYRLTVREVPVDGFWSVSVYNAEGYFEENDFDAYSLNNVTASKGRDGSVDIQFGGCDGRIPNCLPIMPGWNYTVRLYRPRAEILDRSWKFPDAMPVGTD